MTTRRSFLQMGMTGFSADRVLADRSRGLPDLKIENVKVIPTGAGKDHEYLIIKINTSEPGLYGLGSATNVLFTQAIITAVEKRFKQLWIGQSVNRIEELWHITNFHSYWRNSTVHNNILGALDVALWDIKAKRAGMPLYELLGGKIRGAVTAYTHVDGKTLSDIERGIHEASDEGFQHIRVQLGGYGGGGIVPAGQGNRPLGGYQGEAFDEDSYVENIIKLFEHLRKIFGFKIKFLHDVHERISPTAAIKLAKALEPYRLFFLEDIFPPEQIEWFANARQICTTPLAMGEIFVSPNDWMPLVSRRLIDFIRCRVSQIGGITPARKLAAVCEAFGIRTAWQEGGDIDPVNETATCHLELATPNFGIHERNMWASHQLVDDIFPGRAVVKRGYAYVNEKPGLGIEIDEKLALRHPVKINPIDYWTPLNRMIDGTPVRP